MKILHVIATVEATAGGPIEGIVQQNKALMSAYGSREIVTLDPPDAPFLTSFPIKVHAVGMGRYSLKRRSRLGRFSYTPHLVPWLKKHAGDYDCIIVNGLWNYASVGASIALPASKTPYFVFSHGMLDPWFRRTNLLKHFVKQIFWLLFEGRLVRHARSIFFTTEEERLLARGEFWGHPYVETVVGYGTADDQGDAELQKQSFAKTVPALMGRPYLLYLSRIHPKKGCDLLIEAFAKVAAERSDLDLVMAGPDQTGWVAKLKVRAEALGVASRIHWPGMLRDDPKWGAFKGAEAFILPSHQENFGIVVAEALACGTPVLITDKVNIWREVEASGAGMVEPDDKAGIARLLSKFLALSPSDRRMMQGAARACFSAHFDIGVNAKQLVETMQRMR